MGSDQAPHTPCDKQHCKANHHPNRHPTPQPKQSMYKSAVHLLEDLHAHIKLLHTPERAQVRWGRCW